MQRESCVRPPTSSPDGAGAACRILDDVSEHAYELHGDDPGAVERLAGAALTEPGASIPWDQVRAELATPDQ